MDRENAILNGAAFGGSAEVVLVTEMAMAAKWTWDPMRSSTSLFQILRFGVYRLHCITSTVG